MIKHCFKSLVVAVVLALGLPQAAQSQALSTPLMPVTPQFVAPRPSSRVVEPIVPDATSPRPSYWLQGGLIGTAVMVGAAVWLGTLCNGDSGTDCGSYRRTIIFAAIPVGFITGALIGGNIHPHQAEPASPQ